ncbi:BZ3500_MvSof-1268-A1-R1_Chr1-3g02447 [Microbotryum saponariae]|uniref:BZ3500_MvSof-1268-A1-R1_Chr1-3g02447 protein n=1 Tax=Microbotryum saponariae TaxID=289078 RepID=A0A2X0KTG1_9BASI|nr:BZ3500_MvSof-1268-A1-R1_Chr1-3g02447 [Microbotryum saponariae]SCZ96257.1 BZ3501_MvSof-1269-A2-R1_Chr1-3g02050 [Microbotryum saponariae]
MDNNNNNNNTASSVIAPPRAPDPPGHTATATTTVAKSYSAAVGARPAAKPGNATIAPSTDAASSPLMHDIAHCIINKNPSATSFDQVLLALDKHYPALAGAMPCVMLIRISDIP